MSLTDKIVSPFSSPSETHLMWASQSSHLDYSRSRIYQHGDGRFEVIPKPLGVIIGERVIRPLIDSSCNLSRYIFQGVKQGYSLLHWIFSVVSFPPLAAAEEMGDVAQSAQKPCNAMRVLHNVAERSHTLSISNGQAQEAGQEIELNFPLSGDIDVSTPEGAKRYLEEVMGQVHEPEAYCRASEQILHIQQIKKPNFQQKALLKEAYLQLENLAKQDSLAGCTQKLIELFHEIELESRSYYLDALRPMPDLFISILRHSSTSYTYEDLELLVTKANEISRKMMIELEKTNEEEALLGWLDVMVESAAKKPSCLVPSFEVAYKMLEGRFGESISSEQKRTLRKLAKWHKKNRLETAEQSAANKILDITAPQIALLNFFYSYLECIPEDVNMLEESLLEIISELSKSRGSQELVIASIIGLLLISTPKNLRRPLIVMGLTFILSSLLEAHRFQADGQTQ